MNILIHVDYTFNLIKCQVFYYPCCVYFVVSTNNCSQSTTNALAAGRVDEGRGQDFKLTFRLKPKQRTQLIAYFKNNQYPKESEKEMLAKNLGLTTLYVQRWFRRKRRKEWNKLAGCKSPSCKSRKCT